MKDEFCSYYTNSKDITNYMVRKINISSNDVILEPSAGEGIFIDEILRDEKNIKIDALDINSEAIKVLENKYKNVPNITVRQTDTLIDETLDHISNSELLIKKTDTLVDKDLDFFSSIGGFYDKVIGNPPYGAWQDLEKRALLKKKYTGHYVKETYSLFLIRCISVLKEKGRLSFIIPDTFLFLNMQTKLRELLLTQTKIEEILIFPSKFFPGVSFGYSNLSIITLQRCATSEALNNEIKIIKGFKSPAEFDDVLGGINHPHFNTFYLQQKSIINSPQHRFILADIETTSKINKQELVIGDVAYVVTGFYTGDNIQYIKVLNSKVKGSKGYDLVDSKLIYDCMSIDGIHGVSNGYIPYIKRASSNKYIKPSDEWFVKWDEKTIDFYKNNKKSRFQNSTFYFNTGIGIPMVKSKIIRAFLMEDRVFDQSIVGIFPKDKNKILYFLALMNSDVMNDIIHIINPTANNSSNYVKQIPYIEPNENILKEINNMVSQIINLDYNKNTSKIMELQLKINQIINELYSK